MRVKELEAKLAQGNRSKKIRKGDNVVVITGNDKGKTGIVQSLHDNRVVVRGVNIRKKHVKRTQDAPKGRIVEMECPIDVSNVKICVEGDKGVKLHVKTDDKGKRLFVYKSGNEEVVYRSVKKTSVSK